MGKREEKGRVAELKKGSEESKNGETVKGQPPEVERKKCTWGAGGTKMRRCERKIAEMAGSSGIFGEESPTLRVAKDDV